MHVDFGVVEEKIVNDVRAMLPAYKVMNDDAGAMPMYRALTRRYVEALYREWGRPQDARRYAAAKSPRVLAEPPSAAN